MKPEKEREKLENYMNQKEENMDCMNEIELKVVEADQFDAIRPIARVGKVVWGFLDLQSGDLIKIRGGRRVTAAIVKSSDSEDQEGNVIRMGWLVRKNAGVAVGGTVVVQKIGEITAEKVALIPLNTEIRVQDPYVISFIKSILVGSPEVDRAINENNFFVATNAFYRASLEGPKYPLTKGDIIVVPAGLTGEVKFKVAYTVPRDFVVMRGHTQLEFTTSKSDMEL